MRINIGVNHGLLRLRWTYRGKRYSLATGMTDDPQGRRYANARAVQIERDILHGCFDETLVRYKGTTINGGTDVTDQYSGRSVTPHHTRDTPYRTPSDIMSAFLEHRAQGHLIEDSKGSCDYTSSIKYLTKVYGKRDATTLWARDAKALIKYVKSLGLAPRTIKDRLTRISSAFEWAIREGMVTRNPFREAPGFIKIPAREMPTVLDPGIIETIVNWVGQHRPQYGPVLAFIAFTGCRPGEATDLQWKDISEDCSVVTIRASKTGNTRSFGAPDKIQRLLSSLPRGGAQDHVFLNNRGRKFTTRSIRDHGWTQGLKALEMVPMEMYTLRRSFVTNLINSGYPISFVAQLTGHSTDVLVRYYLGKTAGLPDMPDL